MAWVGEEVLQREKEGDCREGMSLGCGRECYRGRRSVTVERECGLGVGGSVTGGEGL